MLTQKPAMTTMSTEHGALSVRVAAKHAEATDICSFELVATDGHALPAFTAGSHVDVQIREGLVRQYSLANNPSERHRYVLGVLREAASRGGSMAMHDTVSVGDVLRISSPKNHFALHPDARRSLLFAGGVGVTPILSMAEHLHDAGADFAMHYCSRSPSRTAFLARIKSSPLASRVQVHHDDGPDMHKLDLASALGPVSGGTHIYVCGPGGFMDVVLAGARAAGWPPLQLHAEFFSGQAQDDSGNAPFDVKLASSGRVITIPADKSIAQTLAEAGIDIPTSCEQGVCGTCLTRVIAGQPDHRDAYLTAEERDRNDQLLPCCSRARSPQLVLDL